MSIFNSIQSKNILVIGDVMLDTYFIGDVNRVSPEAPVAVFRKRSERSVLGGAGNVTANLVSAGQKASIMSVIGKDNAGEKLSFLFTEQEINIDLLFSTDYDTIEKTRFLAANNQQIIRCDIEETHPLRDSDCKIMLSKLESIINKFDLILLSDYLKGLLTLDFTQGIINQAKHRNIPVFIDVKDPVIEKYYGATLLKPNLKELANLTGMPVTSDEQIVAASNSLKTRCNSKYVLTTCGSRGMVLVGDDTPYFVPAVGQEVFDVTGAGDTTIAYLSTCVVNGVSIKDAVDVANLAAGIQVSKVGTSSVYWDEIKRKMSYQENDFDSKIINKKIIEAFREKHKDKRIVFTNGCFDILHIGHIQYLQQSAKLGDVLIVGLNSDASVRRLKGSKRPINCQEERAEMLAALSAVDYVAIFDEDTPLELIKTIQPDVLVKGGDYSPEEVVGRTEVEARGGKLVLLPFVEGKSTTRIIERLSNREFDSDE